MDRRDFLKVASAALAVGSAGCASLEIAKQSRPNIVFLLTDDQAYHLLGYMGNKQVRTPNFDKLAADGVIFDRHYDTTSICMPSRATVMTGLYEYRSGCNFSRGPLMRDKWNESYPVQLRKAGYYTGFAGKFGFAVTDDPEGKSNYHTNDAMPMDSFDVWKGWPGQGYYQTEKNEFVAEYAEKYPHVSRALGAVSQDFIKDASKRDEPFCLSVSFKAPHNPQSPDSAFDDVYADTLWDEPENYDEKGAAHLPKQAKSGRQYLSINHFRPPKYQDSMRKYNQLIYGVDRAIAMIREELERQGVADNTVIMLTSDNGYNCGAHGFSGKVLPYEEGSRAPLLIFDPRHKSSGKGYRCKGVTGNIDMMPTILDYAGLPVPNTNDIDGKSLRPLMDNPKGKVRDSMAIMNVWGSNPTHEMTIVSEDYKYLNWFFAGEGFEAAEELYDLKNDRYEMKNLINDPSKKAVLEKLRKAYDKQIEHWKKTCVQTSGYPEWAIFLDRNIPWEQKEKLIPEKEFKKYRESLRD